ncbi:MAG TPA: sulfotransferase [Gammaproteobacteria bacterium]
MRGFCRSSIISFNFQVFINRNIEDFKEFLFRRRFTFPVELKEANKLSDALCVIQQRWPEDVENEAQESPIFVFSAGWRSGSTLVQRLLMSSGKVLIWGEPLGDTAGVARLSHSLTAITQDWPPYSFFETTANVSDLSGKWVANLAPKISYLKKAHKAHFNQWLSVSSKEEFGVERWGLKEVRLTIDHARYLKWLYPDAKFLFVYRSPFNAYRSWKGNRWRSVWPGYYRKSAIAFARHWKLLLSGYLDGCADVDGLMIKFEDLVSGKIDITHLGDYLGIKDLDESVLNKKIDTPRGKVTHKKKNIGFFDQLIIRLICKDLLSRVGY